VQVPTTLVAQVDSAYGGKTGVDLPEAKNYVGVYHLPSAVIADTGTLATLPAVEIAAGFAEVVKTALIAGDWLWDRVRALERLDPAELDDVIFACVRTKLEIVAADERDAGRRAVLNLGHTVGHAVEAAGGYGRYRHGEAVGLGLLAALRISGADELPASLRWASGSTRFGCGTPSRSSWATGRGETADAERGASRPGGRVRNRVEVMHGVNLDALGRRDPEHYGTITLPELERRIKRFARELGLEVAFFQTNHEGEFVEHLHRLPEIADGALVNAGAWTHYSYAIRDGLEIAALPAVEVHLSDVQSRDEWRRRSVLEGVVIGAVSGKGPDGYSEALRMLKEALE
jgi:3-dehydroquinate dehydratase type II